MTPISNKASVLTSEGRIGKRCTFGRGTLGKDECGLHGLIFSIHYTGAIS